MDRAGSLNGVVRESQLDATEAREGMRGLRAELEGQ